MFVVLRGPVFVLFYPLQKTPDHVPSILDNFRKYQLF